MRLLNNILNHSNWINYYFSKYFNKNNKGFCFKTRNGIDISVPSRMLHTYKECFFDEVYTNGFPENTINNAPVVIDIGANVGYFSLFILNKFPQAKVFSFEPMPVNFKLLNKYKNENPSLDFNIFNKAVSNTNETIVLAYNADDSFTTSATIFDNSGQSDTAEVSAITLASIIEENKLDKIDLLKLDCEGSEYKILYQCPDNQFKRISAICLETHKGENENENTGSLVQFLQERGFCTRVEGDIIWGWR